jgi:hypothetical protein
VKQNQIQSPVRKSIPLRTFISDRKSTIFNVRLSSKINYERILKTIHFYERFAGIIGGETNKRGLIQVLFYLFLTLHQDIFRSSINENNIIPSTWSY